MFYSCKSQFQEKNLILPFEKFLFLVLARNMIMLPHLIIPSFSIICQLVAYGRLKTKENFKLLAIKVVALTYDRWSLTRGSKYSNLTCKLLVFWKTGRLGEVVAYERWLKLQVRLYSKKETFCKLLPLPSSFLLVSLPSSPPYPCGTFDRILLDAPCSALGQRPQFVVRMNLKELQSYPRLQRKLFTTVSDKNCCDLSLIMHCNFH